MAKLDVMLWLSDNRGIYIPRDFANCFIDRDRNVKNVSAEQWSVLESGPDHPHYWDVWSEVCDTARITDESGNVYFIHQDGDCWLVPESFIWNADTECYEEPSEEDESND